MSTTTPAKKVALLLTPRKSPATGYLSSNKPFTRSCVTDHPKSPLPKTFSQFLSPNQLSKEWVPSHLEAKGFLSEQSSRFKRCFLPTNKASKCLFSPGRSKHDTQNNIFTPKENFHNYQHFAPLFDTPQRNSISHEGLRKKVKGFVLGRGSFGVVVRGVYKNENVAVKIVSNKYNLLNEKNALRLNHYNIVKVFQVVFQPGTGVGFVIMELCSLTNLESLLPELIPMRVKLKFVKEIGSALEHCHKNNVLHLDVKPKNVIVDTLNNSCKLCDFGSSKLVAEAVTSNSSVKGTLKYTAPELLRGKAATEKADVYSFGITMWQVFHQEIPYDKEDVLVIVYKVVTQNYRPDHHIRVSNKEVASVYSPCWQAEPTKRPSMSQVLEMLKQIKTP